MLLVIYNGWLLNVLRLIFRFIVNVLPSCLVVSMVVWYALMGCLRGRVAPVTLYCWQNIWRGFVPWADTVRWVADTVWLASRSNAGHNIWRGLAWIQSAAEINSFRFPNEYGVRTWYVCTLWLYISIAQILLNTLVAVFSRSYCYTVWSVIGIILSSVCLSVALCIVALMVYAMLQLGRYGQLCKWIMLTCISYN